MRQSRLSRAAFTLVELLTVIMIITLLMGILTPALQSARDQAKRATTSAQLNSIEKGCEMFRNEMDAYPISGGQNPFYPTQASAPRLMGAQWLTLQLSGADLRGPVKNDLVNDAPTGMNGPGDGQIDQRDWIDWYRLNPTREYVRLGKFVEAEGIAITPTNYHSVNSRATDNEGDADNIPTGMQQPGGSPGPDDWPNHKIPFFFDAYKFPILYYAASVGAKPPYAVRQGNNIVPGVYNFLDNEFIAGNGDGWDLGGGKQIKMRTLGWNPNTPLAAPAVNSFGDATYDRNVYKTTLRPNGREGRVWPHNPEKFILMSPGKDALYGTKDDITNMHGK